MDATFWVGIAFLTFAGVLFYFKVPGMLTKALDDRAEKISDELDQARQLREEAQALLANYERKQRDALTEAEEIIARARDEALREADIAAKKLDQTIARRQQAALEKIALAETQAEAEVREAAIDIAITAATAIVAGQVQGDRADALIDAATADLGRHLNQ
ncbi:MAG: ATP F0F1 synthase subunit B [Alphaproteobacteria bacterium]|jgi:F-type H+-transporting ATPase subunit b|nr:ATP F0F1 synthase subunit B [Alphaproteobacteria bacterium]